MAALVMSLVTMKYGMRLLHLGLTHTKGVVHREVRPAVSLECGQGINQYVNKQKK